MPFDNDQDLTNALISEMTSIIDKVVDQLLEKLKIKIEEVVYSPFRPKKYHRQGDRGLRNEWDKTPAKVTGNVVQAEIAENPMKLTVGPEYFVHGSHYWEPMEDIREILAEIVIEGKSGDFFGEGFWRQPRNFWEPFLKLLEDGTVDRMIETEFKSRGIPFKKI